MNLSRSENKAFTLLEILVAVAVAGILCVMLTTGLKSSVSKAQGANCASQLKQIGVLILQYSADHNNELPPSSAYFFRDHVGWSGAWFDPSTATEGEGTGGLATYIDSKSLKKLTVCPARLPSAFPDEKPLISEGFSYTVNFHMLPGSGFDIVRTTSLERPSSVVLMTDSALIDSWKFGLNANVLDLYLYVGSPHMDRHSNVLWADGHVTTQAISELAKTNFLP